MRVKFRYQIPSNAIYRVGPTVSGVPFARYTTIQAAINAAVADGHTDNTNPATIEIYPGTYAENLSLNAGVHLKGIQNLRGGANAVIVQGSLTLTLSSGTVDENQVFIDSLAIQPPAATRAIVLAGTSPGRMFFQNCDVDSNSGGAGVTGLVYQSNTNSSSEIRLFDTSVVSNNASDTEIIKIDLGTVQLIGGRSQLSNTVTNAIGARISGAGSALLLMAQRGVTGSFTQVFTIDGAGSLLSIERTQVQNTLAGGHLATLNNATCLFRAQHSRLLLGTGAAKIGNDGGAGGTVQIVACLFGGSFTAPRSTIDDSLSQQTWGPRGQLPKSTQYNEFQVGRGVGFSTIQAALDAANASTTGARKTVYVPPGNYTENLTLYPDVDLVADSNSQANNSFCPVTINGVHTLAMTTASGSVSIHGIRFRSLTTNATPLFSVSGNQSSFLRFENCMLQKTFAGAAKIMAFTNTASLNVNMLDCEISMNADSGSSVFDMSGAGAAINLSIAGSRPEFSNYAILTGPQTGVAAFSTPLVIGNASFATGVYLRNIKVEMTTNRMFQFAHASDVARVENSVLRQFIDAGEVFYFGVAATVVIANSFVDIGAAGGTPGTVLVAEDGGSGGTFNYGSCAFAGNSDIKNTLTTTQYAETLTGV